jgi:putative membrane protein
MGNGGFGMGFGGPILWILIIVAIALLVPWLRSQGTGSRPSADDDHPNRALEILEERYARGEIDRDEFDQRRRDLEDTGGR